MPGAGPDTFGPCSYLGRLSPPALLKGRIETRKFVLFTARPAIETLSDKVNVSAAMKVADCQSRYTRHGAQSAPYLPGPMRLYDYPSPTADRRRPRYAVELHERTSRAEVPNQRLQEKSLCEPSAAFSLP